MPKTFSKQMAEAAVPKNRLATTTPPRHATGLLPGDVILTGKGATALVSKAIKLGTCLRYGFKAQEAAYSHTQIVVAHEPGRTVVAEALETGVKTRVLEEHHDPTDYDVIRVWNMPQRSGVGPRELMNSAAFNMWDRSQVLEFVNQVVAARTKYGFVTFIGLAIYCLTGGALCIQKAGTAICSGLVCDALTRAGFIWQRPPYAMMPGDIYHFFGGVSPRDLATMTVLDLGADPVEEKYLREHPPDLD